MVVEYDSNWTNTKVGQASKEPPEPLLKVATTVT